MMRQGDVLLIPVSAAPRSATVRPTQNGLLTLAYGEVTGHHHSIAARPGVALLDEGGVTYLTIDQLTGPADLTHQEHEALIVPPGAYEVRIQCEWSDDLEPRPVQD